MHVAAPQMTTIRMQAITTGKPLRIDHSRHNKRNQIIESAAQHAITNTNKNVAIAISLAAGMRCPGR